MDEDGLMWFKFFSFMFTLKKITIVLVKQEIFFPKFFVLGKFGLFSGMSNYALMHRESVKG